MRQLHTWTNNELETCFTPTQICDADIRGPIKIVMTSLRVCSKVKDTAVCNGIKCVIEFIGLIFRFLNQVKGWQLSQRVNIDRRNMQGVRVFVQHNRGACIVNACRMFSTTHPRAADQRSYKLVVVGGGTGGCSTAARFCHQLGKGKVAVIEPSEVTFTYLSRLCVYKN